MANIFRLRNLSLVNNRLAGPIPSDLGYLEYFSVLSLSHNQLTGEIPAMLGRLDTLFSLSQNNRLSGDIPPELSNLDALGSLFLAGNQLTGCVPAELEDTLFNDFDELGLPFCGNGTTSSN